MEVIEIYKELKEKYPKMSIDQRIELAEIEMRRRTHEQYLIRINNLLTLIKREMQDTPIPFPEDVE